MATADVGGFFEYQPTEHDFFRGVILFGLNSATYKFALAKSLLELAAEGREAVSLEDLAIPFAKHITAHIAEAPKQGTNPGKFLKECARFTKSEITEEELRSATVRLGFVNVIDAFHVVGRDDVPVRFFEDERKSHINGIILTPAIHKIAALSGANASAEVESRWQLVETAWDLGLNTSMILYDENSGWLQTADRRKTVTSARGALSGYQKGRCFYCFRNISIISGDSELADVDHFFPHVLQRRQLLHNLDGVWNLVLSCNPCNRGVAGKFESVPDTRYVERLEERNNRLISSHHPLRETLIRQTGESQPLRRKFLQENLNVARLHQPSVWSTPALADPTF